jgi:hypothetical protein
VRNADGSRLCGDLATALREVAVRIRSLDAPEETRAELTRRLIAVTTTSKRDPAVAARRLERLRAAVQAVPLSSRDIARH